MLTKILEEGGMEESADLSEVVHVPYFDERGQSFKTDGQGPFSFVKLSVLAR